MKKAFTLLETLIVAILFTLLFAAVFEILTTGRMSWNIGSTQQDLENQARQSMNAMARDLYQSNAAQITNLTANSITFRVPVGYDEDRDLLWGAAGVEDRQIRFLVNANGQLIRQILDNASQPLVPPDERILTGDVGNLIFLPSSLPLPADTNTLTISLTTQRASFSYNLSSTLTFRN